MSDGAGKGDRCRSYGKAYRGAAYWGKDQRTGSVISDDQCEEGDGGCSEISSTKSVEIEGTNER